MIGLLAINKDNLTAGNYLLKRFEACLGSLAEQISACMNVPKSLADADVAASETFLRYLQEALSTLDTGSIAWRKMAKILANIIHDESKKLFRQRRGNGQFPKELIQDVEDPRAVLRFALIKSIEFLYDHCEDQISQHIVDLALQGFTHKEIGAHRDVQRTAKTVARRIRRINEKIRETEENASQQCSRPSQPR